MKKLPIPLARKPVPLFTGQASSIPKEGPEAFEVLVVAFLNSFCLKFQEVL